MEETLAGSADPATPYRSTAQALATRAGAAVEGRRDHGAGVEMRRLTVGRGHVRGRTAGHWLLVLVHGGSAAVRIASGAQLQRLHWSSGAILAIPPDVEFGLHTDGDHDVSWVELDARASFPEAVPRAPFVATAGLVRPLLDTLWSALDEGRDESAALIASAAETLRLVLLREARRGQPAPGGVGLTGRQLQRLADVVRARLHEPVAVRELAAAIGFSPYHFCRAFKRATGITPHQYVTAQRLEHARGLLTATRLPVAAVATAVGFSDPGHFAALFRRATGRTPRAYRAEHRA